MTYFHILTFKVECNHLWSTVINKVHNNISPQLIEHKKRPLHMASGPGFVQAQKCGGAKPVNGMPSMPS
jgi:hypothetical protein